MVDFVIRVVIDPSGAARGARATERQLGRLEQRAQSVGRTLRNALAFGGAVAGVRQLARVADRFTTIQNRLRTVTTGQEELNNALGSLERIAFRTRQPLDDLVNLYQRGSIAAAELGASQEELLQFTERVGQALAIQGGSSQEAAGALRQLSQSLGSGIVRAEEFNSILEGAFPIAQAAARGIDSAGGSVARLRQQVVDGEITSEAFFRGFLKGAEDLEAIFARTTPTIGQAFTVLGDQITLAIGRLDAAVGVSAAFARSIIRLSGELDVIGRVIAVLVGAGSVPLLLLLIRSLTSAFIALGAAILANPLVALASLIAGAVVAINVFQDELVETREFLIELRDTFVRGFTFIVARVLEAGRVLQLTFRGIGLSLEAFFTGVGRNIAEGFQDTVNFVIRAANELAQQLPEAIRPDEFEEIDFTSGLTRSTQEIANEIRQVAAQLATVEGDANAVAEQLVGGAIERVVGLVNEVRAVAGEIFTPLEEGAKSSGEEIRKTADAVKTLEQRLEELDARTDLAAGFERGFLRIQDSVNDFASTSEEIITEAFEGAQDAFKDFVRTGELDFQSFAQSIADTLLDLGTQQLFAAILGPSGSGLGGVLGGIFGGGGGSPLPQGTGGAFGGFGGGGGIGGIISGIAGGLFGFQDGGSFLAGQSNSVTIPGGGVDNQLVAFRAMRNEPVSVGQGAGTTVIQNFNFPGADPESFRRQQSEVARASFNAARRENERSGG